MPDFYYDFEQDNAKETLCGGGSSPLLAAPATCFIMHEFQITKLEKKVLITLVLGYSAFGLLAGRWLDSAGRDGVRDVFLVRSSAALNFELCMVA